MPHVPPNGPGSDAFWSEEEWEAYLAAHDREASRYVDLVFFFITKYPRPLGGSPEDLAAWRESLRCFLERHGWDAGLSPLPLLWTKGEGRAPEAAAFPFDTPDADAHLLPAIPAYTEAAGLASDALGWAQQLDVREKDLDLVTWCSRVSQVPAYIAQGHQIGYASDSMPGNIACVRRALRAANESLDQLRRRKRKGDAWRVAYTRFYEPLYELRNTLGAYVQDLRARADLGID